VFFQFYANTLCALVLLWLLWATAGHRSAMDLTWTFTVTSLACTVLWKSARHALTRHDDKMTSLDTTACAVAAGEAGAAVPHAAGAAPLASR
jgi:hypothetical protein